METTVPRDPAHSLGRSVRTAVTISCVVMFVGAGMAMWIATSDREGSLAVGFFTALWGGPGFGIMAGAAAHAVRLDRRTR